MSNLNMSFSMPNLPGMIPNTQSWLYREREGFKKARPDSAVPGRPDTASGDRLFSYSNQGSSTNLNRPSTSQGGRLSQSIDSLKTFGALQQSQQNQINFNNRPKTAGPAVSRSKVSLINDERPAMEYSGGLSKPTPTAYNQSFTPAFVEKDKQVCRFYAHFFQARIWEKDGPLGEPVIETNQARRITIYYYLIDDTVEITEPKAPNTGMPMGTFFRRGPVNNSSSGQPITLRDLAPGNTVFILGQEIFVTDADPFTRDHFRRELNMILPPSLNRPEEIRKDLGAMYATGLGSTLPLVKTNYGTRSTDYLVTKENLEKTNKFLKHDGKVLRFQCVEVRDMEPPYFPGLQSNTHDEDHFFHTMTDTILAPSNVKRFALSYFLTSNSIELVVQKGSGGKKGNGQGEPNLILKKSKLPKNWRDANRGRQPIFYDTMDFKCGNVIDVFGRYFLLVNCDKTTRQIYSEMGVYQQDVPLIDVPEEKIEQPIPQLGDGFLPIGSNEDTLATVYGMPKAGKDIQKIQRNQNRLIRCKAVLLSNNPVDSSREFMITFFLEDDTIQVYEEVKRNSGIWGGNFLKRGRYMNDLPHDQEGSRYFVPSDIYLGNVISFHGNEFQIMEMDNMSLKFCENYPDEFPMMDTFKVIGSMVLRVMDMQLDIRPIFKGCDVKKQGWIDQETFIRTLDGLGLIEGLNDQELLTLMRRFKDEDKYLYPEMCDLFSHVYHQHSSMTGSFVAPSPSRKISQDFTNLKSFLETARGKQNQWRRTLRKDPHTKNGYVTLAVLVKIMHKYSLEMREGVQKEMYAKYRAPKAIAAPILRDLQQMNASSDLYVGLDQKVLPAMAHNAKTSSLKDNLLASLNVKERMRKQSTHSNMTSVLRRGGSHSGVEDGDSIVTDDMSRPFLPASILIDYNKLCDDIYICDWI